MSIIPGKLPFAPKNHRPPKGIEETLFLLLGVSLNITADFSGIGLPVRIGASDFLIPILVGLGFWALLRKHWYLRLQEPTFASACIACSVWFMISLVIGRMQSGQWTSWAIFNRGIGWFIVLAYFFAGVYAAQDKLKSQFVFSGLIYSHLIISFVSITLFYINRLGNLQIELIWRNSGLLTNPNAFGIFTAICFFVYLALDFSLRKNTKFDFYACLIFAFAELTSFSRTGWVLFTLVLIWSLYFGAMRLRTISYATVLILVFHVTAILGSKVIPEIINEPKKAQTYNSITALGYEIDCASTARKRFDLFFDSLRLWRDEPIIGTGIGVIYANDIRMHGKLQGSTLHSSPLWLLTETGLVGFILFSWLYFTSLWWFWMSWRHHKDRRPLVGFGTLILLGLASFTTDVMFQRYLWMIWGIALAVPSLPPAPTGTPTKG